MIITLKRPGICADCGAALPRGTRANWYRGGKLYGLTCHERNASLRSGRTAYEQGDESPGAVASHYDRAGVYTANGTRIGALSCGHEDYPCCGC